MLFTDNPLLRMARKGSGQHHTETKVSELSTTGIGWILNANRYTNVTGECYDISTDANTNMNYLTSNHHLDHQD